MNKEDTIKLLESTIIHDIGTTKNLIRSGNVFYLDALSEESKRDIVNICFATYKYTTNQHLCKKILEKVGVSFVSLHASINFTYYLEEEVYAAHQLLKRGVTTIPFINNRDIHAYRKAFKNTMLSFPEYTKSVKIHVLGGFGAFGNPASFHNTFVRNLRQEAFNKLQNCGVIRPLQMNLQCLFDRMMYRHKGQAPMAELWHRDISITPEGEIFGGWINLDEIDQHFSCVPGSHIDFEPNEADSGFSTLETIFRKHCISKDKQKEVIFKIKKISEKITVPPGHIIIFPQYILHEVLNSKADNDMMRLFTGWRLTSDTNVITGGELSKANNFEPMRLPGGMLPRMYSRMHMMNYKTKEFHIAEVEGEELKYSLTTWCQNTFMDCLLEDNGLIPCYMRGLKESSLVYDTKIYPDYDVNEWKIYKGIPL